MKKPPKSVLEQDTLLLTHQEILRKYHVSQSTLSRWLKEYSLIKTGWGANKLTMSIAQEIRHLYNQGSTQAELAKKFQVTQGAICKIVNNISYKEDGMRFCGSAEVKIGYKYASTDKKD